MMKVSILAETKDIYSSERVKCINIPSVSGEICVYPDHMSIITLMAPGTIRVTYVENEIDKVLPIEISEGIFSFKDNMATCLVTQK